MNHNDAVDIQALCLDWTLGEFPSICQHCEALGTGH